MKKVFFENEKREKLAGILHMPDVDNPPVIIMIHGAKGDKEAYEVFGEIANSLKNKSYAVLLIDCRGSGESNGKFENVTRKSEAEDILTAIEYVKTLNINPEKIGIIGTSMGATATILAYNEDMKALVLMNPVLLMQPEYYKRDYGEIEEKEFVIKTRKDGRQFKFGKNWYNEGLTLDMKSYLQKLNSPTLCIMGSKEHFELKEKNEEGFKFIAATSKEFKIIENGEHVFIKPEVKKQTIEEITTWFNRWLK